MSNVKTVAKSTAVDLLKTVSNLAGSVNQTIGIATSSLDMLDRTVQTARKRQIAKTNLHMEDFLLELHEERAKEVTLRQQELTKILNSDPEFKTIYEANHARLDAVMQRTRTELGL